MTTILALGGSPSGTSRTAAATHCALGLLAERGFTSRHLAVRDLPAEDLLAGRATHPQIHRALSELAAADALIVATPVYKASFTGLLKAFLDLLPQGGLAGKTVLPLATGGTLAHLLAVDYALRPVLCSLDAHHIAAATFLLDSAFTPAPGDAGYTLAPEAASRLGAAVERFAAALPTAAGVGGAAARLAPVA